MFQIGAITITQLGKVHYTEYAANEGKIMSANTNIKQVAITTSASSGIGSGMTQALLEHGYRVIAIRARSANRRI